MKNSTEKNRDKKIEEKKFSIDKKDSELKKNDF